MNRSTRRSEKARTRSRCHLRNLDWVGRWRSGVDLGTGRVRLDPNHPNPSVRARAHKTNWCASRRRVRARVRGLT